MVRCVEVRAMCGGEGDVRRVEVRVMLDVWR